MRFPPAAALVLLCLGACTAAPVTQGAAAPATAAAPVALDSLVRANFSAIMADIAVGGGPSLNEAFRVAGVSAEDQGPLALLLNEFIDDYSGNPDALIATLAGVGG